MKYNINGIQQIGIGTTDVYATWQWYIDHFDIDMPVFEEEATAELMLPFTEGKPRSRHAILALHPQGGGGLEIWKHTSFEPRNYDGIITPGDLGIWALHIKVKDCQAMYAIHTERKISILSSCEEDGYYCRDPWGNIIKVVPSNDYVKDLGMLGGGVSGCSIGVKDIDTSLNLYTDLLGYDELIEDELVQKGRFHEMFPVMGAYRRVVLGHGERKGAFAPLLGKTTIELVQRLQTKPNKLYEGRMWGEPGYIHVCFDVTDMDALKTQATSHGFPFAVDSGETFDMGEAAGRFAYLEEQDGTLIEFVETHKVPIFKPLSIYYKMNNARKKRPLSKLFLWGMRLNRRRQARK